MGSYGRKLEEAPERFGDLPEWAGVLFVCERCGRRTATKRDACLEAWGKRGIVREAAAKLRCTNCRRRRVMMAFLTPSQVGFGSPSRLTRLVEAINALTPSGYVNAKDKRRD